MPGKVGRPSKLTPELLERLKEVVQEPAFAIYTDEDIQVALDIERRTWENLVKREYVDELKNVDKEIIDDFFRIIKKARLTQKSNLHNEMRAGENGWQAKAWILERKFSDLNLKNISEVKEESKQDITIKWGGKKKEEQ